MTGREETGKMLLARTAKCKTHFSVPNFLKILNEEPVELNIKERGIFLIYLSELLLKAYLSFNRKLTRFVI